MDDVVAAIHVDCQVLAKAAQRNLAGAPVDGRADAAEGHAGRAAGGNGDFIGRPVATDEDAAATDNGRNISGQHLPPLEPLEGQDSPASRKMLVLLDIHE